MNWLSESHFRIHQLLVFYYHLILDHMINSNTHKSILWNGCIMDKISCREIEPIETLLVV